MISKETFCKTLQLIREQETVNREVSNVLNLVGNGHFVFGGGQQYYEALMMLLKEAACDQYDYMKALESNNIVVNVRRSRGKDIDAACGQLANKTGDNSYSEDSAYL